MEFSLDFDDGESGLNKAVYAIMHEESPPRVMWCFNAQLTYDQFNTYLEARNHLLDMVQPYALLDMPKAVAVESAVKAYDVRLRSSHFVFPDDKDQCRQSWRHCFATKEFDFYISSIERHFGTDYLDIDIDSLSEYFLKELNHTHAHHFHGHEFRDSFFELLTNYEFAAHDKRASLGWHTYKAFSSIAGWKYVDFDDDPVWVPHQTPYSDMIEMKKPFSYENYVLGSIPQRESWYQRKFGAFGGFISAWSFGSLLDGSAANNPIYMGLSPFTSYLSDQYVIRSTEGHSPILQYGARGLLAVYSTGYSATSFLVARLIALYFNFATPWLIYLFSFVNYAYSAYSARNMWNSMTHYISTRQISSKPYTLVGGIIDKYIVSLSDESLFKISFGESVIATCIILRELSSVRAIVSTLVQFFKSMKYLETCVIEKLATLASSTVRPVAASSGSEMLQHLTTLVGMMVVVPLLLGKNVDAAERILRNYTKRAKSRANILDAVVDAFEFVKNKGGTLLYGEEHFDNSYSKWVTDVNQFIHDLSPFGARSRARKDVFDFSVENWKRASALFKRSGEFVALDSGPENSAHHILKRDLVTIMDKLHNNIVNSSIRRFPYGFVVYGPPDTCKSWTTSELIKMYLHMFDRPTGHDNIWNMGGPNKHDDGYIAQQAVIMDDLGCFQEKVNPDPKLMSIHRFFQNVGTLANMAELSKKETTPLVPEIIGANTNIMGVGVHHIFKDAYSVLRRLGPLVEQDLRPEFRNELGRVDSPKVRGNEEAALILKMWRPYPPNEVLPDDAKKKNGYVQMMAPSGDWTWKLSEVFEFFEADFQRHFDQQTTIIRDLSSTSWCKTCNRGPSMCKDPENHVLTESDMSYDHPAEDLEELDPVAEEQAIKEGLSYYDQVMSSQLVKTIPYAIPIAAIGVYAVSNYLQNEEEPAPHDSQVSDVWQKSTDIVFDDVHCSTPAKHIKQKSYNNSFILMVSTKEGPTNMGWVNAFHMGGGIFVSVGHVWVNAESFRLLPVSHIKQDWKLAPVKYSSSEFLYDDMVLHSHVNLDLDNDICVFHPRGFSVPATSKGLYKNVYEGPYEVKLPSICYAHKFSMELGGFRETVVRGVPTYSKVRYPLDETGIGFVDTRAGRIAQSNIQPGMCTSTVWAANPNGGGNMIIGFVSAALAYGTGSADCIFIPFNKQIFNRYKPQVIVPTVARLSNPLLTGPKSTFNKDAAWTKRAGYFEPCFTYSHGIKPKTKCRPSMFHKTLLNRGFPVGDWVPPNFRLRKDSKGEWDYDHSPSPRAIDKVKSPKAVYRNQRAYNRALRDIKHIIRSITRDHDCSFMTIDEAINSTEFLPSLDMNTSSGYPTYKAKREHISYDHEKGRFVASPGLADAVNEILDHYREGRRVKPIFTMSPKDEMKTVAEDEAGKIRYFMAGTLPFLIAQRIMLGKLIGHYKQYKGHPEYYHVYGANHATDWSKIGSAVFNHSDNVMAGDFSNFDGCQNTTLKMDIVSIIADALLEFGWVDKQQHAMFSPYVHDLVFALVSFRGDVAMQSGGNMSGHLFTSLDNGLTNLFNHMYAFYTEHPDKNFFECVKGFTYGDDSLFASSLETFNMLVMQRVMADCNIKYTDANKSQASKPFLDASEATLLGRDFYPVGGSYSASLRSESILRSLAWRSPATAVDDVTHAASALESARYELTRYLVRDDDRLANELISVYDCLAEEVRQHGIFVPALPTQHQALEYIHTGVLPDASEFDMECDVSMRAFLAKRCLIRPYSETTNDRPVAADNKAKKGATEFQAGGTEQVVTYPDYKLNPYTTESRVLFEEILYRELLLETQAVANGNPLNIQLDVATLWANDPIVSDILQWFSLFRCSFEVRMTTRATPFHKGGGALKWVPRTDWNIHDFANIPRIRSSLCPGPIKTFDFSTNPVYTFQIPFVSPTNYWDIADLQAGTDINTPRNTIFSIDYAFNSMSNGGTEEVHYSIYVRPVPGTLELIAPRPAMARGKKKSRRSKKKRGFTQDTPAESLREGVEEVAHHMYDYVTNMEVATDGPISSMTSAAAAAAGYLTELPVIGQYAGLASKTLNVASKALGYFGYSRPPNMNLPVQVVRNAFPNYANAYYQDNTQVLAYDPQAAIALEPSNRGPMLSDSMSILGLARRWCFVENFNIFTTDAPGKIVFEWNVNPQATILAGLVDNDPYYGNMLYHVTAPFRYNTGSLEIMLMIFHAQNERGTYILSYDPSGNNHASIPSNQNTNIVFDLEPNEQGCTVVTLNVPYQHHTPWVGTFNNPDETYFQTTPHVSVGDRGSLRMITQLPLVSPASTNCTVSVFTRAGPDFQVALPDDRFLSNISPMSAKGDFSITPCSAMAPSVTAHTVGDPEYIDLYCSEITDYDTATGFQNVSEVLYLGQAPNMDSTMDYPSQMFGEKLVSFRALMKRYTPAYFFRTAPASVYSNVTFTLPFRPPPYWRDRGVSTLALLFNSNPFGSDATFSGWMCPTSLQNWMRPCYYIEVGGQRYKGSVTKTDTAQANDPIMYHGRGATSEGGLLSSPIIGLQPLISSPEGIRFPDNSYQPGGHNGQVVQNLDVNSTYDVTIPMYTSLKFMSPSSSNYLPDNSQNFADDAERMISWMSTRCFNTTTVQFDLHTAPADDYTLEFFITTPVYYRCNPFT